MLPDIPDYKDIYIIYRGNKNNIYPYTQILNIVLRPKCLVNGYIHWARKDTEADRHKIEYLETDAF